VTASYDCTVCFFAISSPSPENLSVSLRRCVQGPWTWSNALSVDCANDDYTGYSLLATHDEETFAVYVWNLSASHHDTPALTLLGHEGEVHCVRFCRAVGMAATGGDDRTVRLWDLETGEGLRVLTGTEGKVWNVDMDARRVVAGARYGEVRVWSILGKEDVGEEVSERSLWIHSKTTSAGQVRLHRACLVSADGLGVVVLADFWSTQENRCGCAKSSNTVNNNNNNNNNT
jgi:WD40 repeat protein